MDAERFVGDVWKVLQGMGIFSTWALVLAAVFVAVMIVTVRYIGLGAQLGRLWAHLRSLPPPDLENQPSPPMDMPEGGMPVPGKTWEDGEV